jgi:hypothetical protein
LTVEVSLTELLRESGYEASLITTFNIFPPFYEELLLPRLRGAGCRYNIVLADARECYVAASASESRPKHAGRDYVLCPVRSPGAFHPKVIMLAGRSKAAVVVGSHNLTLSGFGYNRELTTCIRFKPSADAGAVRIARSVWRSVRHWIGNQPHTPPEVREAVGAFRNYANWLDGEPTGPASRELDFLAQTPKSGSLWSQVRDLIPKKVRRIVVLGPFFDERLDFLSTVARARPDVPLIVGIEPDTVVISEKALETTIADFRDASGIYRASGYLHAKAMLFDTGGEDDVLLLGSANPSAPAWMDGDKEGNGEGVVLHRGAEARSVAKDLGLAGIPGMPKLSRAARDAILKKEKRRTSATAHGRAFVATVTDKGFAIPSSVFQGVTPVRIQLMGPGNEVLLVTKDSGVEDESFLIKAPTDVCARTIVLAVRLSNGADWIGFVHQTSGIRDLSRSTKQVQLRAALSELGSDTADLGRLISAIEKVIFDEPELVMSGRGGGKPGSKEGEKQEPRRPDSLGTSLETEKARRHRRILESGDLAYLLDVLLRQLGVGLERRDSGIDEKGRTEEEQVGQDDDEKEKEKERDREPELKIDDAELAKLCRGKVSRLVTRIARQMEQAATKKSRSPTVLLQLVAVLALLRELRAIERHPRWARTHERLAGEEDLLRLLDDVLGYLFGRSYRLYEAITSAMSDERFDELARMKGLLIWLAWECRIGLDDRFSIQEELGDVEKRVHDKAALLEFALMLRGDLLAQSEAATSVLRVTHGGAAAAASAWLAKYDKWSSRIAGLLDGVQPKYDPRVTLKPGDLAVVTAQQPPRLRVVSAAGPDRVSLVDFGEEKLTISFVRDRVARVAA